MRTDSIAEQSVAIVVSEPITSTVPLVAPFFRQISDRSDIVVNDRLIPQGGTDYTIAAPAQRIEQRSQPFLGYDRLLAGLIGFGGVAACPKACTIGPRSIPSNNLATQTPSPSLCFTDGSPGSCGVEP
jgi:hypothetical protein